MKKTVSIMTLSLLTATTLASASPSNKINFVTLNKIDNQFLFKEQKTNLMLLNENELKTTKGEWGWGFITSVVTYTITHRNHWSIRGALRSGIQGELSSYTLGYLGYGSYSSRFLGDKSWWM